MFVNVLCTIKHFRMRKASRSVIILHCNAEAAGFEPANRLRAVNCFRGSLLQPLGHASCYFIGTLSQTISIPLTPFSRGHIRPSCAPELGGHRFAVLRPASDDACPNSPDPLFKGAIRACGLSIAAGPSLLASSGPASDDLSQSP